MVTSNKMVNAAKWNSLSELCAKLFVPISNMLLARVLLPEEFGVVATIMMFITFIDLISESGFQKYIIRTIFKNSNDLENHLNVAFTCNLVVSIVATVLIFIYREKISMLLGNESLVQPLILATTILLMSSVISIQTAVFKKSLNYKVLGTIRIISVLIPIVITFPLALLGWSYWAILLGKIISDCLNLVMLQFKSSWVPKFKFSVEIASEMIVISFWALLETILMWFTTYLGVFYLTKYFSSYFVGIYRTAMIATDGILVTIYMPLLSVMYSAMSITEKRQEKVEIFSKFHKIIAIVLIPSSVGIFLYKDFVSNILLGDNWLEAPFFIGLWSISTMLYVLFGVSFYELYRSEGNFKQPVVIHFFYAFTYVLCLVIFKPLSFEKFIIVNTFVRALVLPLISLVAYIRNYRSSILLIIKNEYLYVVYTLIFLSVTLVTFENRIENTIIENLYQIIINILIYILCILFFKKTRTDFNLIKYGKTNSQERINICRKKS